MMAKNMETLSDRSIAMIDTILSCLGIAAIIALLLTQCTDCTVMEAKRKKSEPSSIAGSNVHLYSKPSAFRLQAPTQDQMDHLHALMTVNQVNHPERMDIDND